MRSIREEQMQKAEAQLPGSGVQERAAVSGLDEMVLQETSGLFTEEGGRRRFRKGLRG